MKFCMGSVCCVNKTSNKVMRFTIKRYKVLVRSFLNTILSFKIAMHTTYSILYAINTKEENMNILFINEITQCTNQIT